MRKQIFYLIQFTLVLVQSIPYPDLQVSFSFQIPNCLHQLGFECMVCGLMVDNKNSSTIIPTAPNIDKTACLPSLTGCSQFQDFDGNQCDSSCFCGFNKDHRGICIPKLIDNCIQLENSGQTCKMCVSPLEDYNFGGGNNDYGKSNDATQCIDNIKSGRPNCLQYKLGDINCGKCRDGYLVTQEFNCAKISQGFNSDNCELINKDGSACFRCVPGYLLDPSGNCALKNPAPNLIPQVNCVRYGKTPNEIDYDYTICLQCEPGSFLNKYNKCSANIKNSKNNLIFLEKGTQFDSTVYPPNNCALTIMNNDAEGTQYQCVLTQDDALVQKILAPPISSTIIVNNWYNCDDWDAVGQQCQSSDACINNSVYNTLNQQCENHSCVASNCKESQGGRWCLICLPGYYVYEGICFIMPDIVTPNCELWDLQTYQCSQCQAGFKLDEIAFTCKEQKVKDCLKHKEEKCSLCITNKRPSEDGLSCEWDIIEQFGGVYGCLEHEADRICKTCFKKFKLSQDKKMCLKINDEGQSCAETDEEGKCILCNAIDKAFWIDLYGQRLCKNMNMPGSYCETTIDGCFCLTCKPNFILDDKGKCVMRDLKNPQLILDPKVVIPGCVQFVSQTECEVCQLGTYLLADNKYCYYLLAARKNTMFLGINNKNMLQEPCQRAQNPNECLFCQEGDIGILNWEKSIMSRYNFARSFCIYNSDDQPILILNNYFSETAPGAIPLVQIKNCLRYTTNNKDASICENCREGYTKSADSQSCYDATDMAAKLVCKQYSIEDVGCTECFTNYELLSDKTCFRPAQTGCDSLDVINGQCLSCIQGWTLDTISQTPGIHRCKLDAKLDTLSQCSGDNGSCMVKKVIYIQDPEKPEGTPMVRVTDCSKGGKLNKEGRCEVDLEIQKNCQIVNKYSGTCDKCADGFFLHIGDYANFYQKDFMQNHVCIPQVKGCQKYVDFQMSCSECQNTQDGSPQVPDKSGWNCVSFNNTIIGCHTYRFGDLTKCLQCLEGFGDPADNCFIPIQNCKQYSVLTKTCQLCMTPYFLTIKGQCALSNVSNCQLIVDTGLCAKCQNGFTMISDQNNNTSLAFGKCVKSRIQGCLVADENNVKCLRCEFKQYALIDGLCFENDGSASFPFHCISYTLNETSNALYCNECDKGFGILASSHSRCIINSGPCVDSVGGRDCFQYEKLNDFESINKCKNFNRPGASNLLKSFSLMLFLTIILLLLIY